MERLPFPFHYHAEMELTYIVRGRGQRIVGEVVEPYTAGDLVLLAPHLPHVWMSEADGAEAYVLHFDQLQLEHLLQPLPECAAALTWIRGASKGLRWDTRLPPKLTERFEQLDPRHKPAARLLAFLELLLTLAESSAWRPICGRAPTTLPLASSEQRIGFALRLMRDRFCSELPQAEVAKKVGMTTSAFSHLFHRTTGQTYQQMLRALRLEHARRLLAATTMTVTEICYASGYNNLSNFNKQFLAVEGQTPRAFREKVTNRFNN